MHPRHLERLRPACPACRGAGRDAPPLELGTVARADGEDVLEGVLLCPEPACRREHPIVDGIPIVVADLAGWAVHQLDTVLRRDDLTPFMESLLGDAAGPGGGYERDRIALSGYGRSHWGDLDRDDPLPAEGSLAALAGTALEMLGEPAAGVWLDAGCAVGRGTVELARRTGDLAVGVDLGFGMLRVAERVRREGVASFPQRRVGLVFDRRTLEVPGVPAERVSFWCADAAALPFPDETFAGALSLNLLDSIHSPLGHLLELGRTLTPGAPALLCSPYDWTATATPLEGWLGGHSQRGPAGGSSAAELRRILSEDAAAGVDTGLVVRDELPRVPWRMYAGERSSVDYMVDLLRLERLAQAAQRRHA